MPEPSDGHARRRAETRRRILDAAVALTLDAGGSDPGVDEIAAAAGASVRTVYLHFGSKAGLARAVVERFATELEEALAPAWEADGPAADRLLEVGRAQLSYVRASPARYWALYERAPDPDVDARQAALLQRYVALAGEAAAEEGWTEDPGEVALFLWSAASGALAATRHVTPGLDVALDDVERLLETGVRAVLRGARAG